MNKLKQQAIEAAYGEFWEQVKDFVDENGWIDLKSIHPNIFNFKFELSEDWNYWRHKTLENLETNNGWIRIESEKDMPKDSGRYWIKDKEFGRDIAKYFTENKTWYCDDIRQFPTHYQPITKPKSPIF